MSGRKRAYRHRLESLLAGGAGVREIGRWHERILAGLEFKAVDKIKQHAALTDPELARLLGISEATLRRARAAGANIVPTSTGAAKAIGLVVPELAGKLHGFAARVPVLTGSLVDLTVELARETTADEINAALERATANGLAGILEMSHEPLVSSDVIKSRYSSVVDAELTTVTGGTQAKVVAWYDNEWGYATRLVELAQRVLVPEPVLA